MMYVRFAKKIYKNSTTKLDIKYVYTCGGKPWEVTVTF